MKAIARGLIAIISACIAGLVLASEGFVPVQYVGGLLAAVVIVAGAFLARKMVGLSEEEALVFAKCAVLLTLVVGVWQAVEDLHDRALSRLENSFEEPGPTPEEGEAWWRSALADETAEGGRWDALKLAARQGIAYGARESYPAGEVFHNTRQGAWVWLCWLVQIVMLILGALIGALAISAQNAPERRERKQGRGVAPMSVDEFAEQVGRSLRKQGNDLGARAAEAMIKNSDDLPKVATEIHYQRLQKESNGDPTRFLLSALGTLHSEWVIEALEKGADPNARGSLGMPAVCLAARAGDLKMLNALVEYGADLALTGKNGDGVLQTAAKAGQTKVMEWLLDGGYIEPNPGATQSAFILACAEGHEAAARELYRRGADVSATDARGFAALHHAAQRGHAGIVSMLLEFGVNLDKTVAGKATTALHLAAQYRHISVVALLLKNGADPNGNVSEGMTPLMSAADAGDLAMAQSLLNAGASKEIKCGGLRAFDYAAMAERPTAQHKQIVSLLRPDTP